MTHGPVTAHLSLLSALVFRVCAHECDPALIFCRPVIEHLIYGPAEVMSCQATLQSCQGLTP